MASWLKDCEICNQGLCAYMDKRIKDDGLTVRSAASVAAEVVEKQLGYPLYTANAIRQRYLENTNQKKRGGSQGTTKHSPAKSRVKREKNRKSQEALNSTSEHSHPLNKLDYIRDKLRVIAEAVLSDAVLANCVPTVHLKNARKKFDRMADRPPENMTPQEYSAWTHYFASAELWLLAGQLQQYYYNQLPEEPKHRAARGRPRKRE